MPIETILDSGIRIVPPRKKNLSEIVKEKAVLLGKLFENQFSYTVCMAGKERAVHIFRVCDDRIKGILCYDSLDIDKLRIIEYKNERYLICPRALKVWDEKDFEKYKAEV